MCLIGLESVNESCEEQNLRLKELVFAEDIIRKVYKDYTGIDPGFLLELESVSVGPLERVSIKKMTFPMCEIIVSFPVYFITKKKKRYRERKFVFDIDKHKEEILRKSFYDRMDSLEDNLIYSALILAPKKYWQQVGSFRRAEHLINEQERARQIQSQKKAKLGFYNINKFMVLNRVLNFQLSSFDYSGDLKSFFKNELKYHYKKQNSNV